MSSPGSWGHLRFLCLLRCLKKMTWPDRVLDCRTQIQWEATQSSVKKSQVWSRGPGASLPLTSLPLSPGPFDYLNHQHRTPFTFPQICLVLGCSLNDLRGLNPVLCFMSFETPGVDNVAARVRGFPSGLRACFRDTLHHLCLSEALNS